MMRGTTAFVSSNRTLTLHGSGEKSEPEAACLLAAMLIINLACLTYEKGTHETSWGR